jgi:hypothetical protein
VGTRESGDAATRRSFYDRQSSGHDIKEQSLRFQSLLGFTQVTWILYLDEGVWGSYSATSIPGGLGVGTWTPPSEL